jgi:SAM-dependent methyltransferase
MSTSVEEFFHDYAKHRADEGRGLRGEDLRALPYLKSGPFAKQWTVRAKSYDAFLKHVLFPMEGVRALEILDLGAGNGWLSYRVALRGHKAVALDIRRDDVDGLGAAAEFLRDRPDMFECLSASFDDLPLTSGRFDIALFNASLHYAQDLTRVLGEATRVIKSGGRLVILDSPFYDSERDGAAMVAEKRVLGPANFGSRANVLLAMNFIEYLTRDRLEAATPGLVWSCRHVRYPLWYELRPLLAKLKRARAPSRFGLWIAQIP